MSLSALSPKTLIGKTLRVPLKLIPTEAMIPVLQGPMQGTRWIVGSAIHGCWIGSFDLKKQKLMATLVEKGSTIYDLGAHVGFYTLLASKLTGPTGKVIAFEPVERNLSYLRRHIAMNHANNCVVLEAAVGSSEGTCSFDFGSDLSQGHLVSDETGSVNVRVVTLDGLVARKEIPPPDFIKIDIEGGEFDALKGAAHLLEKYGPTLFLATHNAKVHRECCKFLKDLGYRLSSLDSFPLELTSEVLAIRR